MSERKRNSDKIRERVERSILYAEEDRRRRLLSKRLELARTGIQAYRNNQVLEAVAAYHSYIKTLEELKNVSEGSLMPAHFDMKKDLPELLMLSGVYWDLAKLFDRTQSAAKYKEFTHYIEKYVIFSMNMPYQNMCAETIRKFLTYEKPLHPKDFKAAYKMLSRSRCFVASALVDVIEPETIPRLQRFRDERLRRTRVGRLLIGWYYRHGPKLADWIEKQPDTLRIKVGAVISQIGRWV